MKNKLITISALILIIFSCAKTQVKDSLIESPHINQPVSATVLSKNVKDKSFADCVKKELKNNISTLKFIPEDKFREALFPWFEPSTYPKSVEKLGSMMNNHLVQDRIQSIGIRFIIFVGGYESKEKFGGPFIVAGGFGAVGALGYTSSDRKSEISAIIWDVKEMASLGDVQVEKSGSFKWIGIILPIPIPDFTKSKACSETAKRLSNCLTGKRSHTGNTIEDFDK
ncbi:hypothetical protein ACFL7M_15710 [Thermodesulfobacteriota bacterium]